MTSTYEQPCVMFETNCNPLTVVPPDYESFLPGDAQRTKRIKAACRDRAYILYAEFDGYNKTYHSLMIKRYWVPKYLLQEIK